MKRIEVLPNPAPDRCKRKAYFVLLGRTLKYLLLFVVAVIVWCYLGDGPNKAKLHGALLTPVAALLALQEFLFFQTRGRMGEALKAPNFRVRELEQVFERVTNLKAYADRLWFIAVPAKMIGLLAGAALFFGGWPDILTTVKNYPITGDAVLAIAGWFAFFVGIDSTWRTFHLFKHIDGKLMELELKARQTMAQKAEAEEFRTGQNQNKGENLEPAKYPRIKLPNG